MDSLPVAFFRSLGKVSEYFVAWVWNDDACWEIGGRDQAHPCRHLHPQGSLQLLVAMEENKTQLASKVGVAAGAKMRQRAADPLCSDWSQTNAVERAPTPARFRTYGIILAEATATSAVYRHLAVEMCKTEPECSYWLRQEVPTLPRLRSYRSRL